MLGPTWDCPDAKNFRTLERASFIISVSAVHLKQPGSFRPSAPIQRGNTHKGSNKTKLPYGIKYAQLALVLFALSHGDVGCPSVLQALSLLAGVRVRDSPS